MSGGNKKMRMEMGIYFSVILQAHTWCQGSLLVLLFLVNSQKNNHKLSDERQALNHGQNPLPIYMILNMKEDYSLSEFKGDGKTEVYLDLVFKWSALSVTACPPTPCTAEP